MSANIARSGVKVLGWNRTPGTAGAALAAEAGVEIVEVAREAALRAQAIIFCLSDAPDLESILFGENGIAQFLQPNAIAIDMGTSGPRCAREVHDQLAKLGVHFLDAPVSGGDVGARNGTLTIMVGGERQIFELAYPLFSSMGKNIRYCGPPGAGQAVKLCNQILCAVNMVGVCEALALADEMSIDPNLIVEVCGAGAGGSWALSNLGPRIVRGDFNPGFMINHMLKDIGLVGDTVDGGLDGLPGTQLAAQKFEEIRSQQPLGGLLGTQAMMLAYREEKKPNSQSN